MTVNNCDIKTYVCPDDVKEFKSGTEMCAAIATRVAVIQGVKDVSSLIESYVNPLSIFKADANTLGLIVSKLNLKMNTTQISQVKTSCDNIAEKNSSTAMINIDNSCIYKNCETFKDEAMKVECIKSANDLMKNSPAVVVSGNTIESKNSISQLCQIIAATSLLTNTTSSIDNAAMQKIITAATNPGSTASSTNVTCNDVSSTLSSCQYAQQLQCCRQKAEIAVSSGVNIECNLNTSVMNNMMSASSNLQQSCELASSTGMDTKQAAAIINKIYQESETKSTGLDVGALCAIFILVILCFFVGPPLIAAKMLKFNMGSLLPIGMIVIGVGCILLAVYGAYRPNEIVISDSKPLSSCPSSIIDVKDEMEYGEAKQKFYDNDRFTGLDFLFTTSEQITDNTNGYAVLYTQVKRDDKCSELKSEITKTNTFAKYRTSYPALLGCGIATVAAGVIIVVVYMIKQFKNQKTGRIAPKVGLGVESTELSPLI
jgi:hypothetical protein